MENNGKASIRKRTKQININYFSITDRVKNGEVTIVWCPKGDMIVNPTTKPLQGTMFRNFRYQIMLVIQAAHPVPGKFKVEHLRKA